MTSIIAALIAAALTQAAVFASDGDNANAVRASVYVIARANQTPALPGLAVIGNTRAGHGAGAALAAAALKR